MVKAFSTLGCPAATLDEVITLARRYGVQSVELRALGGRIDLPAYLKDTFGTPDAFAARLADSGVGVAALDTSFRLLGATAKTRDELLEFLPWAEVLGGVNLRVFDGKCPEGENAAEQGAAELSWWQEQRAKHGWRSDLIVETHDSLLTSDAILELAAAAPLRLLWDSHHTWKKGEEDPVQTWETIRSVVVHVHVKDSVPAPGARDGYVYTLPGDGVFPMASLRQAFAAANFSGPVSLEWERLWKPELAPLEQALERANQGWW